MREYSKEEYQAIDQQDRNEIFDTCIFDTIVEGYLITLMEELGKSKEETAAALEKLKILFYDFGADEVLAIREGFLNDSGTDTPK